MANQVYTSKDTSINSSKLPVIYHKVDFSALGTCCGMNVLDYGCGKFDNARDYIEQECGGDWYGYDKYNRSDAENELALSITPDVILCSNVLNVIAEDEIVRGICEDLTTTSEISEAPVFITVYEGDGTGHGKQSKTDCYQRNAKAADYLRFFPAGYVIRKGVITNAPEFVK